MGEIRYLQFLAQVCLSISQLPHKSVPRHVRRVQLGIAMQDLPYALSNPALNRVYRRTKLIERALDKINLSTKEGYTPV